MAQLQLSSQLWENTSVGKVITAGILPGPGILFHGKGGGGEVGLTRLSDACLICLSVQELTFPDVNFRAVNKLYSLGRPGCLVPKYVPF